jgi:hypothetical protein
MASPLFKTQQELVCESIISGDLDSFRPIPFAPGEIDRPLLSHLDLAYRPRLHPSETYIRPRGPTPVILAILCEQSEILEFILNERGPDLSVRVNGYAAHQIAASIKDPRPLQLLIRYQWVQENIDCPIELEGIVPVQNHFTTALHVAVSNRRIPQMFLLLCEFPPVERAEGEQDQAYAPASPQQLSAAGSSPLHIAVQLMDRTAAEILIAAGAEPGQQNGYGQTPLQLAEKIREGVAGRPAAKKVGESIEGVIELLKNPVVADLEELRQKYATELLVTKEEVQVEEEEVKEEEEEEEKEKEKEEESAPALESKPKRGKLQQILDAITDLTARVGRLEATVGIDREPEPDVEEA